MKNITLRTLSVSGPFLTPTLLHWSLSLCVFSVPGIDLENIVYYKDDTHYFVMTAKKNSLLKKGVIKQVRTTHPLPGKRVILVGTSCFSGR